MRSYQIGIVYVRDEMEWRGTDVVAARDDLVLARRIGEQRIRRRRS